LLLGIEKSACLLSSEKGSSGCWGLSEGSGLLLLAIEESIRLLLLSVEESSLLGLLLSVEESVGLLLLLGGEKTVGLLLWLAEHASLLLLWLVEHASLLLAESSSEASGCGEAWFLASLSESCVAEHAVALLLRLLHEVVAGSQCVGGESSEGGEGSLSSESRGGFEAAGCGSGGVLLGQRRLLSAVAKEVDADLLLAESVELVKSSDALDLMFLVQFAVFAADGLERGGLLGAWSRNAPGSTA
jgi:hypothetical protein